MKFEIWLEQPAQLFVADGVSPTSAFYSEYTIRPAMESVRARVWATHRADHVELTVFLPPGEIRPGLGEELTAAARRWSRVVDESRRIDSRMASAVGRRLILAVLVLHGCSPARQSAIRPACRHPAKPAKLPWREERPRCRSERAWPTAAQTALSALFPPRDHSLFSIQCPPGQP